MNYVPRSGRRGTQDGGGDLAIAHFRAPEMARFTQALLIYVPRNERCGPPRWLTPAISKASHWAMATSPLQLQGSPRPRTKDTNQKRLSNLCGLEGSKVSNG